MAAGGHRIHHNFIHHCQYYGLGYGVCHDKAFSVIEFNVFNWNCQPIAGTGVADSGYEARHNLQLETAMPADGFHFDMHSGADRGDGTDVGGKYIRIHHNTFRGPALPVWLRGVPTERAEIHGNWFSSPVRNAVRTDPKSRVFDNAYGQMKAKLFDPAP